MLGGKWALVTGSSRGIGQQIALGLAQRGCNVIVHG
ncbi:MAG TPA: SDR family NAD(P)-dependent oxidoreductase, partial [Herpetosiphonaceae bacterium]|nr:SDR family NAD(P)-dependent oxidoreductase [Herpetosiphonaceae bacterium]